MRSAAWGATVGANDDGLLTPVDVGPAVHVRVGASSSTTSMVT